MTTFLAADTVNGVYKISQSDVDGEILSGQAFYTLLKGCEDGEIIFAAIDDQSILEKIDAEYGIR